MEELLPAFLEVAAGKSSKRLAHDIISASLLKSSHTGQKLQLRQAAEQRFDQRLNRDQRAIRRERINTALGSRPSEDALAIAGDGETPDVRLGCLAKDVDLAAGVEAQHASAWSRAGVDRAVGGQCQAQDLAILAGVGNGHLPVGRNLEELALVSGGREKIAVLVLDDIPDVGCLNGRQGLELPRQAHSSLAADHRLLELGFVVMCWGVMMPDFDLGSLAGCGNAQDQCRSGGPGVAEHD